MKKFSRKRYTVLAKRKNTDEPWSDWTDTDNYQRAVHHACRAEEAGYCAKIIVREKQIEELLSILGMYEHEKADAVLDAGFCKQNDVVREIILKIDELICCHANGDIDNERLYMVFDKLKKKYLEVKDG